MSIAQQLYEGLEIGGEENVGLISYMRTDSVKLSEDSKRSAREYISKKYGKEYLPQTPNKFKSKKSAQEAHEAIRPTHLNKTPQDLKEYLDAQQYKLYKFVSNP